MSKLRLIKKRESDVEVAGDLRGLGYDPLLKQSFPYAGLFVHGVNAEALKPVCQHLHLDILKSHGEGHLVVAQGLTEGHHKVDTLTLFHAALALAKRHPSAHCRIELVLPLHHMMLRRIEHGAFATKEEASDALWSVTVPGGTRFVLSDASVTFLNHAGFQLMGTGSYLSLSDHQTDLLIETIKKSITKRKEAI